MKCRPAGRHLSKHLIGARCGRIVSAAQCGDNRFRAALVARSCISGGDPACCLRGRYAPRRLRSAQLRWSYAKPVAAYVKNIAADGSFYWVMAVAVPVQEGFVSVRLKPSSELFAQVQSIYAETGFDPNKP